MKLVFLGSACGLGLNCDNFQSNMLLCSDTGKKLLVDCGTDIRFSLAKAFYKPEDIDAIYTSHLHADHIGGLEWFAFQRKFGSQFGLPKLIIHEQLVHRLWDNCLSGGMNTLDEKEATLHDYFVVNAIKDAHSFEWEGVQLDLIKTVHVCSNGTLLPSYGLTICSHGNTFFITTDTQFTPELFAPYYRDATLIFHDCETLKVPSGVHAHFNQLETLDPLIKAKTWLYHYNDGTLPCAQSHGFLGFVQCGQNIDLN